MHSTTRTWFVASGKTPARQLSFQPTCGLWIKVGFVGYPLVAVATLTGNDGPARFSPMARCAAKRASVPWPGLTEALRAAEPERAGREGIDSNSSRGDTTDQAFEVAHWIVRWIATRCFRCMREPDT